MQEPGGLVRPFVYLLIVFVHSSLQVVLGVDLQIDARASFSEDSLYLNPGRHNTRLFRIWLTLLKQVMLS